MAFLSDEDVLRILPRAVEHWDLVSGALEHESIDSLNTEIAALATISVETGNSFVPIVERGSVEYFQRYDGRADLGNTQPGDGFAFRGRGFIQITGRANYERFGKALGVDLVANPELALDPGIAAHVLAAYFKQRGIHAEADAGCWAQVRRRVNGGMNGFDAFMHVVNLFSSRN